MTARTSGTFASSCRCASNVRRLASDTPSSSLLQSLSIRDFRCLENCSWDLGRGCHVLAGRNGAGKTSVLEAIYVLLTTRSFRAKRFSDCLRWDAEGFAISGDLEPPSGTQLTTSWRPGNLARYRNGKPAELADYLSVASALSWSARDDQVVDGDPEARRRLLDQGVVARKPLDVEVLARFRRILNAKKELLKGRSRAASQELDTWNELFAEAGHRLIQLRAAYATELEQAFRATARAHHIETATVRFRYRPDPAEGTESVERFLRVLEAKRPTELDRARALVGPHRDRLEITWGPVDIARSASRGERKLFGLILTLARRQVLLSAGREPILLLDDLDAALDRKRLEKAWKLLEGVPQVVVTTANPEAARAAGWARSWLLDGGRIEPG